MKIATLFIFIFAFGYSKAADTVDSDTCITRIEKISDNSKKAKSYNIASQRAWETGSYFDAVEYASRGIDICQAHNYKLTHAELLNNRGIAYDYMGKYTAALNDYFKALKIAEEKKSLRLQAYILSNIGLIYSNQRLESKALQYHYRSLKIRKEINDLSGISASLNNIAIIYVMQKRYQSAIDNYLECIRIDEELKDERGLGDDYNNIGLCYLDLKDYEQTFAYLEKALTIRKQMDNPLGVVETTNNIGSMLYEQGLYNEAKSYFLKSIPLANEIGSNESLKYSYKMLTDVSEALGDSAAAYTYYRNYIVYRDKIENSANTRLQTELELRYQFDKEKEVTRLEQQKKDVQLRTIIYAVSFGLLLILIFSIMLFRRWKQTQRQRLIIEEKNILVEHKNKEILDSISYANRIQTAILPSSPLIHSALPEHFVIYLPKDIVSGDFYWLEERNDLLLFAVADCTGHGVPGAMMSVVCHNALNRSVREFGLCATDEILGKTREIVISELSKNDQDVTDGMDISLCIINKKSNEIRWSGANNPLWIYRTETGEIEEWKGDNQPIGKYLDERPFKTHQIKVAPNDRVYLFSDGYADQFGGNRGKKMMKNRFRSEILASAQMPLPEQRKYLEDFYLNWKGGHDQIDDVCVACFIIGKQ